MRGSSLIQFHRVLIASGIVFCGGFAAWAFVSASRTGGAGFWVLGSVFAVLAVGLAVYLWNLRRVLGYGDDRSAPR